MPARDSRRPIPWIVLVEPLVVALAAVTLVVGVATTSAVDPADERRIEIEAPAPTPVAPCVSEGHCR